MNAPALGSQLASSWHQRTYMTGPVSWAFARDVLCVACWTGLLRVVAESPGHTPHDVGRVRMAGVRGVRKSNVVSGAVREDGMCGSKKRCNADMSSEQCVVDGCRGYTGNLTPAPNATIVLPTLASIRVHSTSSRLRYFLSQCDRSLAHREHASSNAQRQELGPILVFGTRA